MEVKITERGWAGHFICSDRCLFHRNTLIEYANKKWVVSTVGNMVDIHAYGYPDKVIIDTIGYERYFETMAFEADSNDKFLDADVSKQLDFDSEWSISEPWKEKEANDMHEAVIKELSIKIQSQTIPLTCPYNGY